MSDLIDLIKNERFDFECPEYRKKSNSKEKTLIEMSSVLNAKLKSI